MNIAFGCYLKHRELIQIQLLALLFFFLAGMVVGQRFKAPTLIVVAAVAILALMLIASGMRGVGFWSSALTTVAAAACLQVGYLFGLGIRYLRISNRTGNGSEPTRRTMP